MKQTAVSACLVLNLEGNDLRCYYKGSNEPSMHSKGTPHAHLGDDDKRLLDRKLKIVRMVGEEEIVTPRPYVQTVLAFEGVLLVRMDSIHVLFQVVKLVQISNLLWVIHVQFSTLTTFHQLRAVPIHEHVTFHCRLVHDCKMYVACPVAQA
jgi:hypothetical protein